jgi:hypothetical protein
MYRDLGDVGDVFQACKQNQRVLQRPATLTVPGVFAVLQQIAAEKGDGEAWGWGHSLCTLSPVTGHRLPAPHFLGA